MKKFELCVCAVVFTCFLTSAGHAGGIINKQNLSAEYMRTLNRNAATDMADATVYNPAGVMKMTNGLYLKGDFQYIAKECTNDVPGYGNLRSDEPSYIPILFTLYKQDKWAGFFAVTIPGGGGKIEYDHGNARTVSLSQGIIAASQTPFGPVFDGINSMYLEADSYYAGYTLGGSFAINHVFSIAGGARYVDAYQKFKGDSTLNVDPVVGPLVGVTDSSQTFKVKLERTARGWGYFLGLNVNPVDPLNIGFLYMSNTKLNFESDVSQDDVGITPRLGWADGTHQREDLPGYLAFGASYRILPQLRMEFDYTYYLEKAANLQNTRFDNAGNSWDLGVMLEYTFNPRWKASVGYAKAEIEGMPPESMLTEAPELDSNALAGGVVYSPTDRWALTLSALKVWYEPVTVKKSAELPCAPVGTKLERDVWAVAVGVQYRFF